MSLTNLPPLPIPYEIQQWDTTAAALGIAPAMLMENAAREALAVLRQCVGALTGKRILLCMGGGNNGGDAVCLARHLRDAGASVLVAHTHPLHTATGPTRQHIRIAKACHVPFARISPAKHAILPARLYEWQYPDIIVDGLLGTGFSHTLRPPMQHIISWINAQHRPSADPFIFSLDTPSGCNAATGHPSPIAVKAHATVCFAAVKYGLALPHARAFTGQLYVRDIGIPLHIRTTQQRLLGPSCARFIPPSPSNAHKGSFGRVLVIGGSAGMSGAPHLAAKAALRSGAGLVYVAQAVRPEIPVPPLPDAVYLPVAGSNLQGQWPEPLPDILINTVNKADALVLGPGIGQSSAAVTCVRTILQMPQRPPVVLDADGINIVAHNPDMLRYLRTEDICTPHPLEAARLMGCTSASVQGNRVAAITELASLAPCFWILKGAGTLLHQQNIPLCLLPYDIPALAIAGSGDVLAGCAGSLIAQGIIPEKAAAVAVTAHAWAGIKMQESFGPRGGMASDLADILPYALAHMQQMPEMVCSV